MTEADRMEMMYEAMGLALGLSFLAERWQIEDGETVYIEGDGWEGEAIFGDPDEQDDEL